MSTVDRRPTPWALLEHARQLMWNSAPALQGVWPRASAMLARQALELALEQLWQRRAVSLMRCSLRAQLLCLPTYLREGALAAEAEHAWVALSRACHHHPYELAPTEQELGHWLDTVGRVIEAVDRQVN